MSGASDRPHPQTLGERLSGLGPGDACPCCGAQLRADAGGVGAPELVCPECGCEVYGPAPCGPDARGCAGWRVLYAAA